MQSNPKSNFIMRKSSFERRENQGTARVRGRWCYWVTSLPLKLHGMNTPTYQWAEAHNWATYLRQRLPYTALDGKTPQEVLYRKEPLIGHLHPFYSKCFVRILEDARGPGSKLKPRSLNGYLVGYAGDLLYRVYIPYKRKVDVYEQGANMGLEGS